MNRARIAAAIALAAMAAAAGCTPTPAPTTPPPAVHVIGDSITYNAAVEAYDGHVPYPWRVDSWPGACAADFADAVASSSADTLVVAFGHNYHSAAAPERCRYADIDATLTAFRGSCIVYVNPSFRPAPAAAGTYTFQAWNEPPEVHAAHIDAYRARVAQITDPRVRVVDWHPASPGHLDPDGVHLARTDGDVAVTAADAYLGVMAAGVRACNDPFTGPTSANPTGSRPVAR